MTTGLMAHSSMAKAKANSLALLHICTALFQLVLGKQRQTLLNNSENGTMLKQPMLIKKKDKIFQDLKNFLFCTPKNNCWNIICFQLHINL